MTNKTQASQQEQNKSRIFLEITMEDGSVHQKREELCEGKWVRKDWECVMEAKNAN